MSGSCIKLEGGLLMLHEQISTHGNYTEIKILPTKLETILLIEFHTNLMDRHMGIY